MDRAQKIQNRLRFLGASNFVINKKETNALSKVLSANEEVQSYVFGSAVAGFALMVATNQRLIFIDKFMFDLRVDEVPYKAISCIEYDLKFFTGSLKIFTQAKDFEFSRVPKRTLLNFKNHVEYKMSIDKQMESGFRQLK